MKPVTTPLPINDTELLRLIVAGDERAFTTLYRRHQASVYRFALLMSGSPNIAEEVAQEVFLLLICDPGRYDPARGPLPPYLYGVARNKVLRFLRREQPYVPLVDESTSGGSVPQLVAVNDPQNDCARKEVIQLVRQAVLALPLHYREVVVLCDFQEMTYADAALVLGCPIGTVNSRLSRGHALMLRKLRAVSKLDAASPDEEWMRGMRCFA
jgi:RNA polymerase sigma-70 factor (ECF subfamily)